MASWSILATPATGIIIIIIITIIIITVVVVVIIIIIIITMRISMSNEGGQYANCQGIADGKGRRGFLAMDDGVRHQQALNTVSVFAASMSEQMLVSSQHPADTQQPVVIEAFAEVAGRHCSTYLMLSAGVTRMQLVSYSN